MNALQTIQQKLKAAKSQYNSFGKYNYRNLEDILESVKPLLAETKSTLIISDELVEVGGEIFVRSFATLKGGEEEVTVSAYARHAKEQKGMADSQITGATSSYARKYALSGLFLIDDTKDADATNNHGVTVTTAAPAAKSAKEETPTSKKWLNSGTPEWEVNKQKLAKGEVTIETIKKLFNISKANELKIQDVNS